MVQATALLNLMSALYLLCHSPATGLPDSSLRVSFNRLQLNAACREKRKKTWGWKGRKQTVDLHN